MRKRLLLFLLSSLPFTADAGFLDDIKCASGDCRNDRLLTNPEEFKPRHMMAPRVLNPLTAPQTTPMGLFSPPGATQEQAAPTVVPRGPTDPPEPIPISNNSCELAFNDVCDEPARCATGSDGHDCGAGGN